MAVTARRAGRREARGAAAVEFALVLPILLMILLGIVNFGAAFAQQISLTNIAREAARNAVVDGPRSTCGLVEEDARNGAVTVGMGESVPQITVAPCPGSGSVCTESTPGQDVTVTVTRPAQWLAPFPFVTVPAPTLTAQGVMRCEFS